MVAIALIGAGGVIGRAVLARLESEGHRVRAIGRDICDLADPASCAALNLGGAQALVHAGGITEESARTDKAWAHAAVGWHKVLERAAAAGIGRVVYVSSAHVYGTMEGTIDEATPPDPRSDYALLHFASEQILRRSGIAGSILRPSNVYGMPGDLARFGRWALTPYGFPQDAVRDGRIVLKSSGLQMRNFVAASGVADAASQAVARLQRTLDVVNVAGNDTLSMRDFAHRVVGRRHKQRFVVGPERPPALAVDTHALCGRQNASRGPQFERAGAALQARTQRSVQAPRLRKCQHQYDARVHIRDCG
jgi:UDP-glucose 4-epimerase